MAPERIASRRRGFQIAIAVTIGFAALLFLLVLQGTIETTTTSYRVLALVASLSIYTTSGLWIAGRWLGTGLDGTLDTVAAHPLRSVTIAAGTYLVLGFAVTWGLVGLGLAGWVPETVGWPGAFFVSIGGFVVAWLTWPFHILAFLVCGLLPGGCLVG